MAQPSIRSAPIYPAGPVQVHGGVALAALAAIVLAVAWAFQLIGGYTPCKLCLEQRDGYYAALVLLPLAALAAWRQVTPCVPRGLLVLAGLALLFSMVIGVYQAGAEWRFWEGPTDCAGGAGVDLGGGSLLEALETTRVIRCDEAALRVLGLSFAGWNVLAAGALSLAAFVCAFLPGDRHSR